MEGVVRRENRKGWEQFWQTAPGSWLEQQWGQSQELVTLHWSAQLWGQKGMLDDLTAFLNLEGF